MANSFQLMNEFPETGPHSLGQLLCVSRVTTVWAPSYSEINAAFLSEKTWLSPKFLIDLLRRDNSPIRVMAREEWLRDRSFRDHYAWPGAKWRDGFDDQIREVLDEDIEKALPPEKRRVVVAAPDEGWKKAAEILAKSSDEAKRQLENIAKDTKTLPVGIANRIQRSQEFHNPIETLVRDLLNHDAARKEAGALASFLDERYLRLVGRIKRVGLEIFLHDVRDLAPKEPIDLFQALEMLELLRPLQTQKAFEEWFDSKHDHDRQQLLRLFEHPQPISINEEVLKRLLQVGIKLDRGFFDELFPDLKSGDIASRTFTVGTLAQCVWQLFTAAVFGTGLLRTGVRAFGRYGRRKDWPRFPATDVVDLETNNTAAIFQLVFGTRRPSEGQFRAVVQALRRDVERAEQNP